MTSAYTEALLLSSKREREAEAAASSSSSAGVRGDSSSWRGAPPRGARASRMSYASPRAGGPVDDRRFNHREWDRAHYGLHGATAEERQSQYVRNLYRQQRSQQSRAQAFYSAAARANQQRAGAGAGARSASGYVALAAIAACGSVWSAVYSTNFGRYRNR